MNIQEFLGRHDVPFEVMAHEATYDAQHLAQAVHTSGHHVAKTVLLRAGGDNYVVAVLAATHSIDFGKVKAALETDSVALATEVEMANRCPDCEIGALPPFGSHYDLPTLVDEPLSHDEEIVFEGSTHSEAIRMRFEDFKKLENPKIVALS